MGYGDDFWNGDIDAAMDDQLKPLGMDMAELRQQQTGVVYPPGLQAYEKYQTIFSRPSPCLSRRPFLPQGKVALYNTSLRRPDSPLYPNGGSRRKVSAPLLSWPKDIL